MLNVPHILQTNPQGCNSCVPACLSMVLSYQGVAVSEQELCDWLDVQLVGTEVWNVLLLEQHIDNCRVSLDSASFDNCKNHWLLISRPLHSSPPATCNTGSMTHCTLL